MIYQLLRMSDLRHVCQRIAHPLYMPGHPLANGPQPRALALSFFDRHYGYRRFSWLAPDTPDEAHLLDDNSARDIRVPVRLGDVCLNADANFWVRGWQDDLTLLVVQGGAMLRAHLYETIKGIDVLSIDVGPCPPELHAVLTAQ